MLKRIRLIMKTTDNSSVYKKAIKEMQFKDGYLSCHICRPHRGCNKHKKWPKRSWKSFRKRQYKSGPMV